LSLADVAPFVFGDDVHAALEQPREVGLAQQMRQRQRAEVLPGDGEHVEGIELRLLLSRFDECSGYAVLVEHDHLATKHEMLLAYLQRARDDQRKRCAQFIAAPPDQAHAPLLADS
jgi:hypothetical protein